jgi:hypothetical protein
MLVDDGFTQVAPRYPERFAMGLPRGLREAVRVEAARRGVSAAEIARRALISEITNPTIANDLPAVADRQGQAKW